MALRLIDEYPTQVGPVDANYPHGVPRNVSAPSAGDGTPWEEAWVKDIYGFLSALIDNAAIVHSGTADTAIASQYFQALQALFLQVSQLESAGGTILENSSRLNATGLHGLRVIRDSTVLMTTQPGAGRHIIADDAESTLVSALQKDVSATWALGAAGGMPAALHPVAANQWLRAFVISKPDGAPELGWDTSPVAANLFADAAVIAAGFSDVTRYRRYAWSHVDGSSQLTDFINTEQDPRSYLWKVAKAVNMGALTSANRIAVNLADECPPSAEALLSMMSEISSGGEDFFLCTHSDQTDSTASKDRLHWFTNDTGGGNNFGNSGQFLFPVNSNSDFFVRSTGGTNVNQDCTIHGWRDLGIAA